MPRIGHKCYRFKVSEVCLITIVRLGRSVGRPPMLPCQKIRAQSLQGGPRGWQTGRRTHLEKVANELHHKTFLFIAPKRLNELSWNFLGTLCRCPKNMVSKKISKIRILIRIFPEKSGFRKRLAGSGSKFLCVIYICQTPSKPPLKIRIRPYGCRKTG